MLSEKLIVLASNTEKVFKAGYNKCLKENPPGASEEELETKYQEGYGTGYNEGHSSGYMAGTIFGLESAQEDLQGIANYIEDVIAVQNIYIIDVEDISITILDFYDYTSKKIICTSKDTWADIIANDYNGIISSLGLAIGDNGYVRYNNGTGSYLYSNGGTYCKASGIPISNMLYRFTGTDPTE